MGQVIIDRVHHTLKSWLLKTKEEELYPSSSLKAYLGGWRDGSAVKSTSEGPEFKSQQTHDGPQPSVQL